MTNPLFSEVIEWGGHRFNLELFDEKDYSRLKNLTQVYGFIFNNKKEILIIKSGKDKPWSLPGGGPEKCDKSWQDTLIREVDEEANIEIENIQPALYTISTPLDNSSHARAGSAIRAVAFLKKAKPRAIDPALGIINEIKFVPAEDFLKYCLWGENGKLQLEIALKTAREKLRL